MEIWVENIKTKKTWKLDSDVTKDVFIINGEQHYKYGVESIHNYKFYPVCPKEAPTMNLEEREFTQMSIFDYEVDNE